MTWERANLFYAFFGALAGEACVVRRKVSEADWSFDFGEAYAGGTALWRLIDDGRVVLTGNDDGHWFGFGEPVDAEARANALLAGKRVEATSIDNDSGDLHVRFSDGVRLDLIHNSMGTKLGKAASILTGIAFGSSPEAAATSATRASRSVR